MKSIIFRIFISCLLAIVTIAAKSDEKCEADVNVDNFEDTECVESNCEATLEFDVVVQDCPYSIGNFNAIVAIESPATRDEVFPFTWELLVGEDDDTELEEFINLTNGEKIGKVDIDQVECICKGEKPAE